MATATAKKKVVEMVEGVTLELSKREAEFLRHVFGCIAGEAFWNDEPGENSMEGPGSRIFEALQEAGVGKVANIELAYAAFNFSKPRK